MSNSASFADKWKSFWEKASPVFKKIGNIFSQTGFWIWRLRKVLMAIPVVYAAVRLAIDNMNRLPENVGLNLQETGEFALIDADQFFTRCVFAQVRQMHYIVQ